VEGRERTREGWQTDGWGEGCEAIEERSGLDALSTEAAVVFEAPGTTPAPNDAKLGRWGTVPPTTNAWGAGKAMAEGGGGARGGAMVEAGEHSEWEVRVARERGR
jgi:hypothetical protein